MVPVERLSHLPALARGLMTGSPDVSAFLPDRPTAAAIARRAEEVLAAFRKRDASTVDPNVLDLATGRRAGVFTGQQAGLFTGPLLALVKALAAVQLAEDVTAKGTELSPVFWCATEDHDLVEVTRFVLPTAEGPRDLGPDPTSLGTNRHPVGSLPLGVDVDALLSAAVESLGQPADEEVLAALRASTVGKTFREAFVTTLAWLLSSTPLRTVDAARREDKRDLVPLAVRLVVEREKVRAILLERAAALEAASFPLQVTSDPSALPLFAVVDGERCLLVEADGAFVLKGRSDERFAEADVVGRFESGEWLPSFSALTRPVAASVLYPVAATILGPAEIAYWAQSLPLFAWAGVVPPVLVPRPLSAVVEAPVARILGKLGLSLADALEGAESVVTRCGAAKTAAARERLASLRDAVDRGLGEATPELVAIDASLGKSIETTRGNVRFALDKLLERAAAAAGRADETLKKQAARLEEALVPNGQLAERVYTPVTYLLRHGRERLVEAIRRDVRWDRPGLQPVEL
ncbi:MAG TPA: bacillithiol biosynthesis BshC [Thermoanaerobaculia bacterium]|nr:bacillithiol biosynthesis BshC [Thermoanaerobaculia bacterium]